MKRLFSQRLGIDLGTVNTLVYEEGAGIVLNEPSVVAVRPGSGEIVAVGSEAHRMLGKTPGQIEAVRPLREGVIADFATTRTMLRTFMGKVISRRLPLLKGVSVVLGVPCGITEVEKRAVEEAARAAGARETFLIDEPVAAALGAGVDVLRPRGCMVVDIGGGTSEAAVISLGGIVERRSLRAGGDAMDHAIAQMVRAEHGVCIGQATAEQLKIALAGVEGSAPEASLEVRGRSLLSGLPERVSIAAAEVSEAVRPHIDRVVDAVRQTLENTPPELAADICEDGIIMTGGSSQLRGLAERITRETGILTRLAERPLTAVAEGAGSTVEALSSQGVRWYARRAEA